MMLLVFFARVRPASTRANPACITKTRMPAISVQTTFRLTWTASTASIVAGAAALSSAAVAANITPHLARIVRIVFMFTSVFLIR